eukprot:jgi/Ulvmu1/2395/UM131_0006.1
MGKQRHSPGSSAWWCGVSTKTWCILPWVLVLVSAGMLLANFRPRAACVAHTPQPYRAATPAREKIFVSYSYFEKDEIQKKNFDFFILRAMGVGSVFGRDKLADYFVVVQGDLCTPCQAFDNILEPEITSPVDGIAWARHGSGVTLLKRIANEGMDFAAHNTTMTYAQDVMKLFHNKYRYFMFVNSSVKGPFTPKYYPFHWSEPFLSRINRKVKAVSSSIVCLPIIDSGGPGPKLESWAFATDSVGLKVLTAAGVFVLNTCKICVDGLIVTGEYGMAPALFDEGFSIDTLMAMYGEVDWHNRSNWNCNDQVHPSRHGTYDGISMNPFETVFLKASWHVGEPFADKYAAWSTRIHKGQSTTIGALDEQMYRYAIEPEAQDQHPLIYNAYQVGPRFKDECLRACTVAKNSSA